MSGDDKLDTIISEQDYARLAGAVAALEASGNTDDPEFVSLREARNMLMQAQHSPHVIDKAIRQGLHAEDKPKSLDVYVDNRDAALKNIVKWARKMPSLLGAFELKDIADNLDGVNYTTAIMTETYDCFGLTASAVRNVRGVRFKSAVFYGLSKIGVLELRKDSRRPTIHSYDMDGDGEKATGLRKIFNKCPEGVWGYHLHIQRDDSPYSRYFPENIKFRWERMRGMDHLSCVSFFHYAKDEFTAYKGNIESFVKSEAHRTPEMRQALRHMQALPDILERELERVNGEMHYAGNGSSNGGRR